MRTLRRSGSFVGARLAASPSVLALLVLATVTVTFHLSSLLARGQGASTPWPTYHHNNQRTGRTAAVGPASNNVRWHFSADDAIASSPAIGDDGTLYFGAWDGNLYAVNPDGTLQWTFATADGISSSPAIDADGTIYFGSYDSKVYAVNPEGSLGWEFTTDSFVTSSPAIASDGTVYIGSWDGALYALNPDGSLKWQFQSDETADEPWITSSPAIGPDGTIYIGSWDHFLYAVNPDGSLDWEFETGSAISSTPAIGPDGTIYIGSWDGTLYALSPDGNLSWSYTTGAFIRSSPALATDGTVYISTAWDTDGTDDVLYAITPPEEGDTGVVSWDFNLGVTTVAEGDQIVPLPVVDGNGVIYIGGTSGNLFALNPDGSEEWRLSTRQWLQSSPAIDGHGVLYFGSYDTQLYAIGEPTRATPTPTATTSPTSPPTTTTTPPLGAFTPTPTNTATGTSTPTQASSSTPTATGTVVTPTPTSASTTTATSTPTATSTAKPTLTLTPTSTPQNCAIVGNVYLQGRQQLKNYGSTRVSAIPSGGLSVPVASTLTEDSGAFAFDNLQPGSYIFIAKQHAYLRAKEESVQCVAGQTHTLNDGWLAGGDVDDSGKISIIDLVLIGLSYNMTASDPGWDQAQKVDVTGNGWVNIFDLVLGAINFRAEEFTPWNADFDRLTMVDAMNSGLQPVQGKASISSQQDGKAFDVRIENMHGLYGIDLTVIFDASKVTLVDADGERPGVQVELGEVFEGRTHMPPLTDITVDEETGVGTLTFATTLIRPSDRINGDGVVLSILYEPVNSGNGTGAFSIDRVEIGDQRGRSMQVDVDGNVIRQIWRALMPFTTR